jgi:hypothetical protein
MSEMPKRIEPERPAPFDVTYCEIPLERSTDVRKRIADRIDNLVDLANARVWGQHWQTGMKLAPPTEFWQRGARFSFPGLAKDAPEFAEELIRGLWDMVAEAQALRRLLALLDAEAPDPLSPATAARSPGTQDN